MLVCIGPRCLITNNGSRLEVVLPLPVICDGEEEPDSQFVRCTEYASF